LEARLKEKEDERSKQEQKMRDEQRRKEEEERIKRETETTTTREIVKEVVVVKEVIQENKNNVGFEIKGHKGGYRKVFLTVVEGRNMIVCNLVNKKSDPFVVCKHYSAEGELKVKMKTKIIQGNHINPYWDETMEYRDFEEGDFLALSVWDDGRTGYDFMGEIRLFKNDIKHSLKGWHPLKNLPKKPSHPSHEKKKKKEQQQAEIKTSPREGGTEEEHRPEKEEQKKGGFFSKVKSNLPSIHMSGDSVLHTVSNTRNNLKDKIRGKKDITGDLFLAFETIQ